MLRSRNTQIMMVKTAHGSNTSSGSNGPWPIDGPSPNLTVQGSKIAWGSKIALGSNSPWHTYGPSPDLKAQWVFFPAWDTPPSEPIKNSVRCFYLPVLHSKNITKFEAVLTPPDIFSLLKYLHVHILMSMTKVYIHYIWLLSYLRTCYRLSKFAHSAWNLCKRIFLQGFCVRHFVRRITSKKQAKANAQSTTQ